MSEVLYSEGTKVFDLMDCKTIRTRGTRVAAIPNGLGDEVWGESRGRRVQRAHLVEAPLYATCLKFGGVGDG